MKRMTAFAKRNAKEILRDPLNLIFGIGFPVGVMLLLSLIQSNIPVPLFEIEQLAPGMTVFGLSFISLFAGQLIAKDRGEAFLTRLYASPMRAADYILGYILPVLPIASVQSAVCFLAAYAMGLKPHANQLLALLTLIPVSLMFISVGLLAGSALTEKQVGGICGGLLTNVGAWLSGVWFDLDLVGGAFARIASLLPFSHAANAARAASLGQYSDIIPELMWIFGYAAVITLLAVITFKRRMTGDER